MKKKLLLVLLAVSLAFNLAVIATFGHHWMMRKCFAKNPEGGPMFFNPKFEKSLGLTDKQAEFLEKDRAEMKKIMEPMRDELRNKREELFTLIDEEKVDNAKVDKLIGEISSMQANIEREVVKHSIGIKQNMTPEQRAKFKEFLHKHFKKPPHGGPPMNEEKPF